MLVTLDVAPQPPFSVEVDLLLAKGSGTTQELAMSALTTARQDIPGDQRWWDDFWSSHGGNVLKCIYGLCAFYALV